MKNQGNTTPRRERNNFPTTHPKELPDEDFKIIFSRKLGNLQEHARLNEIRKITRKRSKKFNTEVEIIRKTQTEPLELENAYNRGEQTSSSRRSCELEDSSLQIIPSEERKERKRAKKGHRKKILQALWEAHQKEEGEKGAKSLLQEIMAKNFPDVERDMDIQIHKARKAPKRSLPRHITIQLLTIKDKKKDKYHRIQLIK